MAIATIHISDVNKNSALFFKKVTKGVSLFIAELSFSFWLELVELFGFELSVIGMYSVLESGLQCLHGDSFESYSTRLLETIVLLSDSGR